MPEKKFLYPYLLKALDIEWDDNNEEKRKIRMNRLSVVQTNLIQIELESNTALFAKRMEDPNQIEYIPLWIHVHGVEKDGLFYTLELDFDEPADLHVFVRVNVYKINDLNVA